MSDHDFRVKKILLDRTLLEQEFQVKLKISTIRFFNEHEHKFVDSYVITDAQITMIVFHLLLLEYGLTNNFGFVLT